MAGRVRGVDVDVEAGGAYEPNGVPLLLALLLLVEGRMREAVDGRVTDAAGRRADARCRVADGRKADDSVAVDDTSRSEGVAEPRMDADDGRTPLMLLRLLLLLLFVV